MDRRLMTALVTATALGMAAGCKGIHTATDLQMAYIEETRCEAGSRPRDMADNALLRDMCVSDIHFVAHTAEIGGTGTARLDRLASLLNAYGGTLHYETDLRDEELIRKRLDHVREYLAMAGCNMDRVKVETGLCGGQGMPADRAIRAYEHSLPAPGAARSAGAPGAPGPVQAPPGSGMGSGGRP
jgi:hypothetical protein